MAKITQHGSIPSLDEIPAAPPPPGVIPNFINPKNQEPAMNATLIICLGVATISVWLRVYTKLMISKSHGYDDYASVTAWAGFVSYCALQFSNNRISKGSHIWDTPLSKEARWLKIGNVIEICYGPLIFITKLSILLQYIRIFVPTRRSQLYYWINALIWTNFLFYLADTLVEIFQCTPRNKIWSPKIPGRCVNINIAFVATAAVNVISDFSILLLPLGCIWQLQMPTRRKLSISAIFATGLFGCIASIMRLVYNAIYIHSRDPNHDLVPVVLWTDAEIASGILCGCLPVLPQYFRHVVPKLVSMVSTSRIGRQFSKKYSSNPNSGRAVAWVEPYDPRLLQGTYLELGDLDRRTGPSTTIEGGKQDSMDESQGNKTNDGQNGQGSDTEREAASGQILKTVRVESSF